MLFEGRTLANQIRASLPGRAAAAHQKSGRAISLAAIGSTEDYGASVYLQKEMAAAEKIGIKTQIFPVNNQTPADVFLDRVRALSADPAVDAILIPRPLPEHLAATSYASILNPQKDIDGMSSDNMGRLFLCKTWAEIEALPGFVPCTAMAVIRLLQHYQFKLEGAAVTVIGRSSNVGRPLAHLLSCQNATVTLCHTKTDLPRAVKDADLICSAAGQPGLLKTQWLKPGASVIDISTNWYQNRLCGDANAQELEQRGLSYSPVPGGVGPVTLALLLENLVLSRERILKESL